MLLSTKACLVKAMVFPLVMYGCQSWAIKNSECQRIYAFWTVTLEKTLESPLDCEEIQPVYPKGNQSWIFTGRTVWSWNSNPLSTWCEELTRWKRPWLWERLKLGGEGDNRGWDGWMASPSLWTWVWINSGSFWWTGKLGMLAIHEVAKSWTQPNEWIRLLYRPLCFITILSDDWHRMHTQTDSFLEKC